MERIANLFKSIWHELAEFFEPVDEGLKGIFEDKDNVTVIGQPDLPDRLQSKKI